MNTLDFNSNESEAAAVLGVVRYTAKRWRLDGKIPAYCYVKTGYKTVRYCLPLLRNWQQNPHDIEAQTRAIELLQNSLPSNAPRQRGRKST